MLDRDAIAGRCHRAWKWMLTPVFFGTMERVYSDPQLSVPSECEDVVNFTHVVGAEKPRGVVLVDRPRTKWRLGLPFVADGGKVDEAFRRRFPGIGTAGELVDFMRRRRIVPVYVTNTIEVGGKYHDAAWLDYSKWFLGELLRRGGDDGLSVACYGAQAFRALDRAREEYKEGSCLVFEISNGPTDTFDWFLAQCGDEDCERA